MSRKTVLSLVCATLGAAASAEDVTLERSGFLRCAFGGGITAGGLVNYDCWTNSARPVCSIPDKAGYVLARRGEMIAEGRWTIGGDGAGGVTATNGFTLAKDLVAQAAGTRIYLPFAAFRGGAWSTDTGKFGVFPANGGQQGLFIGRDVRRVDLSTPGGEEIAFAFPEKRFVSLGNAWGGDFTLRLQPPRELKVGDRVEDVFTVSVKGRALTYAADVKTYTAGGADWVPVKMLKGVHPGGATDFSGWRLQDAPAGKYGWLRRAGGHFEFEGRPAGESVRFYGVNLVGSCCWPTREQADEIVDRLVRSGYNTVRLHHFDGGLAAGTGDPTSTALNLETVDRLDYLVARCIQAGIYVTIDLFSARVASEEWRSAIWKKIGRTPPAEPAPQEMKALIHLSDDGFENWKAYAGNFLNHVNPYTGRAYKDEPGMPLLCLVNEGAPARWMGNRSATERECMDVEERSLARMTGFMRSLGVRALLTDMNNGPHPPEKLAVREKWLDYFDNHAYIDHPEFLGARWSVPFCISNIDVLDYPEEGPGMSYAGIAAAVRIPTMPYTITEWNFSSPGAFRFQGGLHMAALAVNGRWDGLWRFTYAHDVKNLFDSSRSGLSSFDVMLDPVQQATERALVALYLRGDAQSCEGFSRIDREAKTMTVDTPRTQGGFARANGAFSTSGMSVRLNGAHAAVWATAVDCKPLASTSRILLTHLTEVQNTDTQWADREHKIVVKRGWLPLLARAGEADVALVVASGDWKAYALGTDGARVGEVPVALKEGRLHALLRTARDPSNATLLYEFVRN